MHILSLRLSEHQPALAHVLAELPPSQAWSHLCPWGGGTHLGMPGWLPAFMGMVLAVPQDPSCTWGQGLKSPSRCDQGTEPPSQLILLLHWPHMTLRLVT